MSAVESQLAKVRAAIEGFRFTCATERELQTAVSIALISALIPCDEELWLSKYDRCDFFCDGVVVELKTNGSVSAVGAQIIRYLVYKSVSAVLLVTTREIHRRLLHLQLGKPLSVLVLPVGLQ